MCLTCLTWSVPDTSDTRQIADALDDGIGLTGATLEHLCNPPNEVLDLMS